LASGSGDAWLRTVADTLAPHGRLALIHRSDALPELLASLTGRFGGLVLRFVHPKPDAAAIRVLVRATKGSRAPPAVVPPLILHRPDGRFTDEAEDMHRGRDAAPT
jgi:tRNA1(Val) A37 N6-methylase TrmN6